MVEINLKQAAVLAQVGVHTMLALIERSPDFPVVERGRRGRPWRFDGEAVASYIKSRRAERANAFEKRQAAMRDVVGLPSGPDDNLSLDDRIKATKLRELLRAEVRQCRQFVIVDDVRRALSRSRAIWGAEKTAFLKRVAISHNLPEVFVDKLSRELNDTDQALERNLDELLSGILDTQTQLGLF